MVIQWPGTRKKIIILRKTIRTYFKLYYIYLLYIYVYSYIEDFIIEILQFSKN